MWGDGVVMKNKGSSSHAQPSFILLMVADKVKRARFRFPVLIKADAELIVEFVLEKGQPFAKVFIFPVAFLYPCGPFSDDFKNRIIEFPIPLIPFLCKFNLPHQDPYPLMYLRSSGCFARYSLAGIASAFPFR